MKLSNEICKSADVVFSGQAIALVKTQSGTTKLLVQRTQCVFPDRPFVLTSVLHQEHKVSFHTSTYDLSWKDLNDTIEEAIAYREDRV